MGTNNYDPSDVAQFYGKTFVTKSGSRYVISDDGRVSGKYEAEGGKIEYIAAGDGMEIIGLQRIVNDAISNATLVGTNAAVQAKRSIKKQIKIYGRRPAPGRRLIVVLTDEDTEAKNCWGFSTSPIERIE